MIQFKYMNRGNEDSVGLIPGFLSERDPRPAKEQIDANYAHGGGWSPYPNGDWKMMPPPRGFDPHIGLLKYSGDPRLVPLAVAKLRDEKIVVYDSGITAIIQKDGSFEVARLD